MPVNVGFESSTGLACLTLGAAGAVTVASTISYTDDRFMPGLSSTAIHEYESSTFLEDDPSLLEETGSSSIIAILYRQRLVRRYRMDLSGFNFLSVLCGYIRSCLSTTIDILSQTHLPPKTVDRFSLLALLLTSLLNGTLHQLLGISWAFPATDVSGPVYWMVPASVSASVLVCLAVVITTYLNPTHRVILTGLVTMFVMECLFPVAVSVSMALCLFNCLKIVDALVVSASMFVVGSVYSRCVRAVLYPSLGLG